jgi:hypothetical protein
MQKIIYLLFIVSFFCSCKPKPDVTQLIKDYYKEQESMAGGSHIKLKDFTILETHTSGDTTKATVVIKGTYIPNQVPGSGPTSEIADTLYWGFYKKDGKWKSTYNGRPW